MSLFNPSTFNWPSSAIPSTSADTEDPSGYLSSSSSIREDVNQQSNLEPSDEDIFEDAEAGEEDRPNIWRGSNQKYKSLIADARQTKDGLDRLNDQDLSAHLFNIHGLKRGLYPDLFDNDAAKPKLEQWKRKERLFEDQGWFPRRTWTAWPLEPGVVPRRDERVLWDRHRIGEVAEVKKAFKARLMETPSQELEDVLLAEFTKQARKKFEAREWDVDRDTASEEEEEIGQRTQIQGKRKRQDDDDTGSEDHRRKKLIKTARHETGATLVNRSGTPLGEGMPNTIFKPIVLADDEDARSKTQPMINSIVSKVDSLLTALHHSRTQKTRSVRIKNPTKTGLGQKLPQYAGSRSMSPASSSKSDTADSDAGQKRTTEADENSRKQRACRPRDWSEVLGMAAILGWDTDVIRRTQARCEALFAERMTFRDVNSGPYDSPKQAESAPSINVKEEFLNGVHLDNFMQPIPRYRASRRYKRRKLVTRSSVNDMSGHTSPKSRTSGVTPEEEEDHEESIECTNCGTNYTTNWRRDPSTKKLLCNPCGVYLHRVGEQRPKKDPVKECSHCKTKETSSWRRSRVDPSIVICRPCSKEEDKAIKQKEQVVKLRYRLHVTCSNCGKPWTKGFRAGPDGPGTLCIACGAYLKRNGEMRPVGGTFQTGDTAKETGIEKKTQD